MWGVGKMDAATMRDRVNAMVREERGDSGVVSFFYLKPPASDGGAEHDTQFLQLLQEMTRDVGPCLLVRAEESVITTEL